MMKIAVRVIVPLIFIFAAYVFFKGHNSPGGGFIAGLIASVGIVLYRMAEGRDAFMSLVPVRPGTIVGTGLLIALATGLAPMVYGLMTRQVFPFLTSHNEYWNLPFSEDDFHFTSVLFFDLGVFIVVVGVSVVMINRLEEELE
jgi:multisubunit Na+/H+ antiporter MnhB subunit